MGEELSHFIYILLHTPSEAQKRLLNMKKKLLEKIHVLP